MHGEGGGVFVSLRGSDPCHAPSHCRHSVTLQPPTPPTQPLPPLCHITASPHLVCFQWEREHEGVPRHPAGRRILRQRRLPKLAQAGQEAYHGSVVLAGPQLHGDQALVAAT